MSSLGPTFRRRKKALIGWRFCHPSAAPRPVKHPTKQASLTKSGAKLRKRDKKRRGRGGTMCHNILLPSKVDKEWHNIPLLLELSINQLNHRLLQRKFCNEAVHVDGM